MDLVIRVPDKFIDGMSNIQNMTQNYEPLSPALSKRRTNTFMVSNNTKLNSNEVSL